MPTKLQKLASGRTLRIVVVTYCSRGEYTVSPSTFRAARAMMREKARLVRDPLAVLLYADSECIATLAR